MCGNNPLVMSCTNKRIEKDIFEHCYTFNCGPGRQELWAANGIVHPCGSFVISVPRSCGAVQIFLNGETTPIATLTQGRSVIISSDPLELIQVVCNGSGSVCKINLCLTLNYECC